MNLYLSSVVLVVAWQSVWAASPSEGVYNIGVGRYDITGPAAGVNMMGYGDPGQVTSGIHMRLYARAFIIDDGRNRFVFVNMDLSMGTQLVKMTVVEKLQEKFGNTYTTENVILSGDHTHSCPGGFIQYFGYQMTSLGFIKESFDAIVKGVVESIAIAHNSMTTGRLYYSIGELTDASINRSPLSYDKNPEEERARYQYNTDKDMTLLKFVTENGTDLGMINWFAVHTTSMNKSNTLISSDNKGYAEELFEKAMDPGSLAGRSSFVAAFAQSNSGDVSPNTGGPKCKDTGEPCDNLTSTCNERVTLCYAAGPGRDMVESTKIIGTKQFEKAMELYNDPGAVQVVGPVGMVSQQLDMSNYTVQLANGSTVKTCRPALGFSFAAGATDGPGRDGFFQGANNKDAVRNVLADILSPVAQDQISCHDPKPILFNLGDMHFPYDWGEKIVETQIARVGQFVIAALPAEITTMAGRRLRDRLSTVFAEEGVPEIVPVIAGLSNAYTHYVTTFEEYAVQRYEGASTLFGPHTLEAYLQQYSMLARALVRGETVDDGPDPPNLLDKQITLFQENLYDSSPLRKNFGDVLEQPKPVAYPGETVTAKFVSAHPGNTIQLGSSFLTVERQEDDGRWKVIATDADWETRFMWRETSMLLRTSVATVEWSVPLETKEGVFRITHTGYAKSTRGKLTRFFGATEPFRVSNAKVRPTDDSPEEPEQNFLSYLLNIFKSSNSN